MTKYVVTIAREYGSGGKTIGRMLAQRLSIRYYDKDLIKLASDESGINERFFHLVDEKLKGSPLFRKGAAYRGEIIPPDSPDFVSDENLFNFQAKIIKQLAEKEPCVIVGRCADFILKDYPNVLKLFVHASREASIRNVVDRYGISEKEADRLIERTNRARAEYYKYYTGRAWENAKNYDLCLDTSRLGFDKCLEIIVNYLEVIAR